jgi:parallel beta-helix repeat protein
METPDTEGGQHEIARISAYTVHAPIYITDDSEFTAPNGVTGGTGTSVDPYIISGWDINASTDHGIHIEGTSAYFTIKNCYIHDGGLNYEGIYLDGCMFGTVTRNVCIDNYDGVYLSFCNSILVNGNNCTSHNQVDMYGIYSEMSNGNTFRDNNCSNCDQGIYLGSSSLNTLSNNMCNWNNWDGIDIYGNDNILTANTCVGNDWEGIYLESAIDNTLNGNNCSDNGDEGIYLWLSNSNTLSGNTCILNTYDGIGIENSSNNKLNGNRIGFNNWDGIWLNWSNGNNISSNFVYNNSINGVDIWSGNNNRICNNTFIGNNGSGSSYNSSHVQSYDDGTGNLWNYSNKGNYWFDWRTPDNSAPWAIVDNPYNISGSASAKDFYPLVYIPENIAPVTTVSLSGTMGQNEWYVSDVNITLSATDVGSGFNRTEYRINLIYSSYVYNGVFTFDSEGDNNISYWSYDNIGNMEAAKVIRVKMDKTAPVTVINWTGNNHIAFIPSDNVSGVNKTYYSIDLGPWQEIDSSLTFGPPTSGNHTIRYYSTDNAGNQESVKTVYVDNGMGQETLILIIATVVVIIAAVLMSVLLIVKKRKGAETVQPPPPQMPPTGGS